MMKNSKVRRILLLLACAVLLVSLSVGATLAYLTSTKTVTNTFTVGKVEIKLDEADVYDEDDEIDDITKLGTEKPGAERVMTNKYRLLPGKTYTKDPTVTVLANSEACYVRVKVTVDVSTSWPKPNDGSQDTFETWAEEFADNYIRNDYTEDKKGFNAAYWTVSDPSVLDKTINTTNRTVEYILTYKNNDTNNIVKKDKDKNTALPAIFDNVCVPTNLDKDALAKLAGMSIKVVAEAIQAEGFTGESDAAAMAAAWDAFSVQHPEQPEE